MKRSRIYLLLGFAPICSVVLATTAKALWSRLLPTDWPVERLIENVTRQLAEHPGDVDLEYNLGRIHGYAFVFETEVLGTSPGGDPRTLADRYSQESKYGRDPEAGRGLSRTSSTPDELLAHLKGAIQHHLN